MADDRSDPFAKDVIALCVPTSGTAGLWGASSLACARLAGEFPREVSLVPLYESPQGRRVDALRVARGARRDPHRQLIDPARPPRRPFTHASLTPRAPHCLGERPRW